jgi:hypothetical protein
MKDPLIWIGMSLMFCSHILGVQKGKVLDEKYIKIAGFIPLKNILQEQEH